MSRILSNSQYFDLLIHTGLEVLQCLTRFVNVRHNFRHDSPPPPLIQFVHDRHISSNTPQIWFVHVRSRSSMFLIFGYVRSCSSTSPLPNVDERGRTIYLLVRPTESIVYNHRYVYRYRYFLARRIEHICPRRKFSK